MSATDLIADMLTRVRNANMVKFSKVDIILTKMNQSLAEILKEEGYIKNYKVLSGEGHGILRLFLKYDELGRGVINGLRRESRCGLRRYVKWTGNQYPVDFKRGYQWRTGRKTTSWRRIYLLCLVSCF